MDDLMLRRRMMAQKKRTERINIDGTWTGPDNKYSVTINGNQLSIQTTLSYGGMGDFVIDFERTIFSVPAGASLTLTADPAMRTNERISFGQTPGTSAFDNSFIRVAQGTAHDTTNTVINNTSSPVDITYMTCRRYYQGTSTYTISLYLDGEQIL